jgi:hypothetical protein
MSPTCVPNSSVPEALMCHIVPGPVEIERSLLPEECIPQTGKTAQIALHHDSYQA